MERKINENSSNAEKNEFYGECISAFTNAKNYTEYLALAKKFKLLGNYKESLEYSHKCERAASPLAYKDVTERLSDSENLTFEGFFAAADVMESISGYRDAKELARIYRLKGSAIAYAEAIAIFEESESGIDDWERGVTLLSKIKSYKNARELYDRYYGHYAQKRYEQATEVLNRAGTNAECMLAFELFSKISTYSDAARQAEAAKKKAQRYKVSPRQIQKEEKKKAETQKVKKQKSDNVEKEKIRKENVWAYFNKKLLFAVILCFVLTALGLWGSIIFRPQNRDLPEELRKNAYTFRGCCIIITIVSLILGARLFIKMMTPRLREIIRERALEFIKSVAGPIAKMLDKMLSALGLNSSSASGGKDERSFVYTGNKTKSKPKKLKNSAKWEDQQSNSEKVRFIFVDYMIAKIKGGYIFRHNRTPDEMRDEISESEDESLLFDTYRKARYAGNLSLDEIDNLTVEKLRAVTREKK